MAFRSKQNSSIQINAPPLVSKWFKSQPGLMAQPEILEPRWTSSSGTDELNSQASCWPSLKATPHLTPSDGRGNGLPVT